MRHALPHDNHSIDTGDFRADLRGIRFVATSEEGCVVVRGRGRTAVSLRLSQCEVMNNYVCQPDIPEEAGAGLLCKHGSQSELLDCTIHSCAGPGLHVCAVSSPSQSRFQQQPNSLFLTWISLLSARCLRVDLLCLQRQRIVEGFVLFRFRFNLIVFPFFLISVAPECLMWNRPFRFCDSFDVGLRQSCTL